MANITFQEIQKLDDLSLCSSRDQLNGESTNKSKIKYLPAKERKEKDDQLINLSKFKHPNY